MEINLLYTYKANFIETAVSCITLINSLVNSLVKLEYNTSVKAYAVVITIDILMQHVICIYVC